MPEYSKITRHADIAPDSTSTAPHRFQARRGKQLAKVSRVIVANRRCRKSSLMYSSEYFGLMARRPMETGLNVQR